MIRQLNYITDVSDGGYWQCALYPNESISLVPNDIVKNPFYKKMEVFVFYECIVSLDYIRYIELLNNMGNEEGLLG